MNYGKDTSGGGIKRILEAQEERQKEAARLVNPVMAGEQVYRGGQPYMKGQKIDMIIAKENVGKCSNFIIIKKQGCELGGEHEGVRFDFPSKVTDMTS
jgi:hypothetical protein